MKLPNPNRAVVHPAKLRDYCLNPEHPRGRHKARVFASALGLHASDAEILLGALRRAAGTQDANPAGLDEYGQRYVIDFDMEGRAGRAIVRSNWIVRRGEDFPRFVSCFVR